jgi:ATP-binding cassette subfamily F protein 3
MITLRNVTLRRGVKVVLDNASVTLNPGEKIGLVGRNGAGKSSLFALLAGRLGADAGDFDIPSRWRMGEVAQNMPETEDPATDFVMQGDTPLMEAEAALAAAEAADDGEAMAHAYMQMEEANAFDARSRAQSLLMGLGFKLNQLDAPVNSFSGGWRMRLQLARALMCPSDLMLLDEPTNHLDIAAREAIEAFLIESPATLLVVSHDRRLLENICEKLWVVGDGLAVPFDGGYRAWRAAVADGWTIEAEAARRANRIRPSSMAPKGVLPAKPSGPADRSAVAIGAPAMPLAKIRRAIARPKLSKDAYRRRSEALDAELSRLGLRKTQLELAMTTPSVAANFVEMRRVTSELADVERALAEAEDAWLELEEQAP